MSKRVLYARVSRTDQCPENQIFELEEFIGGKFDAYYIDHGISGAKSVYERAGFSRMIEEVDSDTTIYSTRVDRWGRGSGNTISIAETLLKRGVKINILQIGKVLQGEDDKIEFDIHAVLAANELKSIKKRVISGLARRKAEGVILGKRQTNSPDKIKAILADLQAGVSRMNVAHRHGVSEKSVSTYKKQYSCAEAFKQLEAKWNQLQKQISMKGSV